MFSDGKLIPFGDPGLLAGSCPPKPAHAEAHVQQACHGLLRTARVSTCVLRPRGIESCPEGALLVQAPCLRSAAGWKIRNDSKLAAENDHGLPICIFLRHPHNLQRIRIINRPAKPLPPRPEQGIHLTNPATGQTPAAPSSEISMLLEG